MEEIWKDIPGFEGFYQASTFGRIRSVSRYVNYKNLGPLAKRSSHILSPKTTKKGYLQVTLMKNGISKFCRVHRLVAETFLNNPNNYTSINHINENKKDNRIENLEWCTAKQNTEAYHESRTIVYQYNLEGKLIKIWHSITKAAEAINGDKTGIQHCCKGILYNGSFKKTYFGYIWSHKPLTEKELKERMINNNLTQVIQTDLEGNMVQVFDSMANAAKAVNCNPSAISMACSGLRNVIKGYKWKKV